MSWNIFINGQQASGFTDFGGFATAPPPAPPVEITFQHAGASHRVRVEQELLVRLLNASANYEAQLQAAAERAAREQAARRRMPEAFTRTGDAIEYLRTIAGSDTADLKKLVLRAKRRSHPDVGGAAETFRRVTDAEQLLRNSGRLA